MSKFKIDYIKLFIGICFGFIYMAGVYFIIKNYMSNEGLGHLLFGLGLVIIFLRQLAFDLNSIFDSISINDEIPEVKHIDDLNDQEYEKAMERIGKTNKVLYKMIKNGPSMKVAKKTTTKYKNGGK